MKITSVSADISSGTGTQWHHLVGKHNLVSGGIVENILVEGIVEDILVVEDIVENILVEDIVEDILVVEDIVEDILVVGSL